MDEKDPALREIYTGINQFKHYLFDGSFGIIEAKVASSKAALLAASMLKNVTGEIPRFDPDLPLRDYMISDPDFNYLNKRLKFIEKGEALFYWFHALKILEG